MGHFQESTFNDLNDAESVAVEVMKQGGFVRIEPDGNAITVHADVDRMPSIQRLVADIQSGAAVPSGDVESPELMAARQQLDADPAGLSDEQRVLLEQAGVEVKPRRRR